MSNNKETTTADHTATVTPIIVGDFIALSPRVLYHHYPEKLEMIEWFGVVLSITDGVAVVAYPGAPNGAYKFTSEKVDVNLSSARGMPPDELLTKRAYIPTVVTSSYEEANDHGKNHIMVGQVCGEYHYLIAVNRVEVEFGDWRYSASDDAWLKIRVTGNVARRD